MSKPTVFIDASKAIRQADRAHKHLSKSTRAKAIAAALNNVARKARVQSSKEIRKIYKIRAKDIAKATTVTKAHKQNLKSVVLATGRPLPIMAFNPRKTKRGVTVNIMGKRKRFAHAFFATMRSGHKGVFVRGTYYQGKLMPRRKRLKTRGNDTPITEVKTVGVPTAFASRSVMTALFKKIETDLPTELDRAFNYFGSKV